LLSIQTAPLVAMTTTTCSTSKGYACAVDGWPQLPNCLSFGSTETWWGSIWKLSQCNVSATCSCMPDVVT
jgi:hypothetical protein